MIDGQEKNTEVVDATCNLSKVRDSKISALKEDKKIVKKIKENIKEGIDFESDEVEFEIRKDLI